jgi:hypothetical protein
LNGLIKMSARSKERKNKMIGHCRLFSLASAAANSHLGKRSDADEDQC